MFSAGQVTRMENYVTSNLQNLLINSVTACQDPCEADCGCTDPDACNYDATASNDDGSCDYSCQGCTDATACNYDPDATEDDGSCVPGELQTFTMTILTDNYPAETTWEIADASGMIVMSGGPYASNATSYTSTEELCSGCYTLTVYDSWGDGMCCDYGEGNYGLSVAGEVVASGASFGSEEITEFCVEPDNTEGCTDAAACNYDATAIIDNSSCVFATGCDFCSGSTDGTGSVVDGDGDDDGVCDSDEIAGCQDELACNYNPDATDEAACEYAADGFDCDGNPISCPEDINGNGTVEVSDVLLLLSDFGCTSDCTGADIDGDGAVSVTDVLLLLAAFGEEC